MVITITLLSVLVLMKSLKLTNNLSDSDLKELDQIRKKRDYKEHCKPFDKNVNWLQNRLKEKGQIEEVKRYPAGRNKMLIVKTVHQIKQKKNKKNDRRLCLVNYPSNPENIKFTVWKKADCNYQFYIYPEGRRINQEEFNSLLGSLIAYRYFKKKIKSDQKVTKTISKMHLGLRSIHINDTGLIKETNRQLRRLMKKYSKFVEPSIIEDSGLNG